MHIGRNGCGRQSVVNSAPILQAIYLGKRKIVSETDEEIIARWNKEAKAKHCTPFHARSFRVRDWP
jgi:hypothetical protein